MTQNGDQTPSINEQREAWLMTISDTEGEAGETPLALRATAEAAREWAQKHADASQINEGEPTEPLDWCEPFETGVDDDYPEELRASGTLTQFADLGQWRYYVSGGPVRD